MKLNLRWSLRVKDKLNLYGEWRGCIMKKVKVLSKKAISILDMVLFSVSIATALYLKDTYNISLWLYIIVA